MNKDARGFYAVVLKTYQSNVPSILHKHKYVIQNYFSILPQIICIAEKVSNEFVYVEREPVYLLVAQFLYSMLLWFRQQSDPIKLSRGTYKSADTAV